MGCDEIHTGRTSWLSEKDLNLPSPFPNCHKKFPLQPNSQHQYYRSDVFIAVFSLPSSLLQHHTCVSSHSYFISILVLRSPPSLAPSSCLFSTSLAHSGKWSKGAVTPIIKELLKLALTGHLVATECQQRFSFGFDRLSFHFIVLNSALSLKHTHFMVHLCN